MGERSKKTAPKVAPRTPAPPPLPPLGLALPASIGVGTLLVYTLTLYPTVPPGDSGELIAAAYTLGVAHPPGYPLHTLIGKLFTLIPYGSVAWRVNFLSAVSGAAAAVFLFLAVTRLSRNVWGGLVAAGLFAFAPIVWAYAIAAEVFALNNLLLAGLFYLIVHYLETREWRIACAAALTTWERFIAMKYWDIDYRRALRLLYHSNEQKQNDVTALTLAAGIMERLVARHPAPAAGLYKNLGLAYYQLRGTLAGAEAGMQRFWKKYLEVAPATDAELPEIRRLLGVK